LAQEPSVPADLQARIDRQGCVNKPSLQQKTIVYGEFAAHGQRDWVAMCAFDGQWILFYRWGGPAKCEGDGVHFPWKMTLARSSPVAMRRLAQQQERKVPVLVHDGIVEIDDIETTTLYCSAGRWTEVTRQRRLEADTLAALRRLVRRSPNDFPEIPGFNLISGQFARRGQGDWKGSYFCTGGPRNRLTFIAARTSVQSKFSKCAPRLFVMPTPTWGGLNACVDGGSDLSPWRA
jgi:hypothetical protein